MVDHSRNYYDPDQDYEAWHRHGQQRGWVRHSQEQMNGLSYSHRPQWQADRWSDQYESPSQRYGATHAYEGDESYLEPYSAEDEADERYIQDTHGNRVFGQRYNAKTFGTPGRIETWRNLRFAPRGDADTFGDLPTQTMRGRGSKTYRRPDSLIHEQVIEMLTHHHEIDGSHIDVRVQDSIVELNGTVNDKQQKHLAEDLAGDVLGVQDVRNNLRVAQG